MSPSRTRPPATATVNLELHASLTEIASRVADLVGELLAHKPDAVLLLPAGRTPVPLYAELVRRVRAERIDLSSAHLFQLDELLGVPAGDRRSFQTFLRQHLLEAVPRDHDRDHLLDGASADPAAAIERHAQALEELGGADLVLLGIGRNGHVAFNEPGTTLDDGGRVVQLADMTVESVRKLFPGGDSPTQGITLGMREISFGREIALVATGERKADILASLVRDEPSAERPASLLVRHPGFLVLADAEAARHLGPGEV